MHLISTFLFVCYIIRSLYFPKSEIFSHLVWLYSPVWSETPNTGLIKYPPYPVYKIYTVISHILFDYSSVHEHDTNCDLKMRLTTRGLTPNMQREITTNYFVINNSTNMARQKFSCTLYTQMKILYINTLSFKLEMRIHDKDISSSRTHM